MRTTGSGRYGALAGLLLAFFLGMAALAALNYIYAEHAARSVAAVGDISGQQAQPQVILSTTQMLRSNLAARRFLGRELGELNTAVAAMDASLAQLDPLAADQGMFGFAPLAGTENKKGLQALKQLWSEYRQRLNSILGFKADAYVETAEQGTQLSAAGLTLNLALEEATSFGVARHRDMSRLIGELTGGVAKAAQARADTLRLWLAAGLALCAFLFVAIVLFVFSVGRKERKLARAKRESDDILRTVNQGLFLLDDGLKLGSERSEALETIFRRKDFDKLDFSALLRGLVPEKTLDTASEYVRLLWGERVNEKLIKSINPLSEVEVSFDLGNGKVDTQYLEFDFSRVQTDESSSRVLVTVNDVTRRVELARELHDSQEKAQAQLDLLLHILHVEPSQLTSFLEESEVSMKMVNAIMKEPAREETAFRDKLDGIFRQIHTVKGEAAALGLKTVEQRAHSFEESLSDLRGKPKLDGNDFLPLVVKLDDLFSHFAQIRDMIGRLSDLRVAMSTDQVAPAPQPAPAGTSTGTLELPAVTDQQPHFAVAEPAPSPPAINDSDDTLVQRPSHEALEMLRQNAAGGDIESAITQLAHRIARKQSKKVDVNCSGLERVPNKYRRPIKDIAIQMVRNSLAHGIESPQERSRANKAAAGAIVLRFENHGTGGCEFVCQDDGRGLSVEQLKETALERGLINAEQAATLDERRALSLIFMAGFSTQTEVTDDAGRGVGMDVVRAKVQELGGKIGISTVSGKFLRFRIWLPASSEAQAA